MQTNPSTELRASDYGLKTINHPLFVLFFCLLSIVYSPSSVFAGEWLEGANGYARGQDQAKVSGKPLVLYVYTDWCPYCRKFEKHTLADAAVKKVLENFVLVRINPDNGSRENQISEQYGVEGYPSIYFTNPSSGQVSQEVTRSVRSAKDFARAAAEFHKVTAVKKKATVATAADSANASATQLEESTPQITPDHILHLKNGRKVEGKLVSQDGKGITLSMADLGEVYFSNSEFSKLEKISP